MCSISFFGIYPISFDSTSIFFNACLSRMHLIVEPSSEVGCYIIQNHVDYKQEMQFVDMEAQAEFMEGSMAGSTSMSTPEGVVSGLMQQVADHYGLEVSVGMLQAAAHVIPATEKEKVDEACRAEGERVMMAIMR